MKDTSHFRDEANRARRLASDQTDPVLKVSLRKYADECITRADEIEDGEIASSIAEEEEPPQVFSGGVHTPTPKLKDAHPLTDVRNGNFVISFLARK